MYVSTFSGINFDLIFGLMLGLGLTVMLCDTAKSVMTFVKGFKID